MGNLSVGDRIRLELLEEELAKAIHNRDPDQADMMEGHLREFLKAHEATEEEITERIEALAAGIGYPGL